jgi:hypothetical protein
MTPARFGAQRAGVSVFSPTASGDVAHRTPDLPCYAPRPDRATLSLHPLTAVESLPLLRIRGAAPPGSACHETQPPARCPPPPPVGYCAGGHLLFNARVPSPAPPRGGSVRMTVHTHGFVSLRTSIQRALSLHLALVSPPRSTHPPATISAPSCGWPIQTASCFAYSFCASCAPKLPVLGACLCDI